MRAKTALHGQVAALITSAYSRGQIWDDIFQSFPSLSWLAPEAFLISIRSFNTAIILVKRVILRLVRWCHQNGRIGFFYHLPCKQNQFGQSPMDESASVEASGRSSSTPLKQSNIQGWVTKEDKKNSFPLLMSSLPQVAQLSPKRVLLGP